MTTKLNPAAFARIVHRANEDAQSHQEEFPGQPVIGDWDSEAFSIARNELNISDDICDDCWDLYRDELHRAVDKICAN